jgi:DnaK suppressor protein
MDETQVAERLNAEEARIRSLLTDLETGGLVEHTGLDEHLTSSDDNTMDGGTDLMERTLELGIVHDWTEQLREVDEARRRLADGTYGRCSHCNEPIAPERLEALPLATTCVEHASTPILTEPVAK